MVGIFNSAIFNNQVFNTGSALPSAVLTQGYMSGSYVTQMSEAEFERKRKKYRHDLNDTAFRMFAEKEMPELHAAIISSETAHGFKAKRSREKRLSALIDRQIRADHEREMHIAEDDAEDEMIISLLLN